MALGVISEIEVPAGKFKKISTACDQAVSSEDTPLTFAVLTLYSCGLARTKPPIAHQSKAFPFFSRASSS